jgi:hypothetical protein
MQRNEHDATHGNQTGVPARAATPIAAVGAPAAPIRPFRVVTSGYSTVTTLGFRICFKETYAFAAA